MSNLDRMKRVRKFSETRASASMSSRFDVICKLTPNQVFGNHYKKLKVIDQLVDASQLGSLSDEQARKLTNQLYACKPNMTEDEYFEAVDMLDVILKNNLTDGIANGFYNTEWVFNPNKDYE